jgi:hypothetical protein
MKYYLNQLVFLAITAVLILAPWFVMKTNLTAHYVFYIIAIGLAGYNLITATQRVVPIMILIASISFAAIFVNKAKEVVSQHEKTMFAFMKILGTKPQVFFYPYNKEAHKRNWKTVNLRERVKSVVESHLPESNMSETTSSYYFDEDGNLSRTTTLRDKKLLFDSEYEYDNDGHLIKDLTLDGHGVKRESTHEFDEYGRRIAWKDKYESKTYGMKFEYKDIPNGYFMNSIILNGSFATVRLIKFTYDPVKRESIEVTHSDSDSTSRVIGRNYKSYDTAGNVIESWEKDKDDYSIGKGVMRYDRNNREIYSKTSYPDSSRNTTYTTKYDSLGNMTYSRYIGRGSDFSTEYTYTFDSWGNWIRRETKGSDGISIIARKIEYY